MALFSTAGADAVHLSAGAEDGNGVKCQVEHCPGSLSRWAELNALHAPAACAIKVWTMAPPPQHCRCSGWATLFRTGAACWDTLTTFLSVLASARQADPPARPPTPRTRTPRLCSPSVRWDLWETTACASRASLLPCTSPPLLLPQERRRGVRLLSTSRHRWPRRARPAPTRPHTVRTRWEFQSEPVSKATVQLGSKWSWREEHRLYLLEAIRPIVSKL